MKKTLFLLVLLVFTKLCDAAGGDTLKFPNAFYQLKDGDIFYTDLHYKAPHDSTQRIINGRLGNKNIATDAMIDPMKLDTSKTIYLRKMVLDSSVIKAVNITDTGYIAKLGTERLWSTHLASQGSKTLNDTIINGSIQNLSVVGTALFNGLSNAGTIATTGLNATQGTFTGSKSTNDTVTNLQCTYGNFTGSKSGNDTVTNARITNLTATSTATTTGITNTGTIATDVINATQGTFTGSKSTNDTITNARVTNLTTTATATTAGITNSGTITTDSIKNNNGIKTTRLSADSIYSGNAVKTDRIYCIDSIKIGNLFFQPKYGELQCTLKTLDFSSQQLVNITYVKFGNFLSLMSYDEIGGTSSSETFCIYGNFASLYPVNYSPVGHFAVPRVVENSNRYAGRIEVSNNKLTISKSNDSNWAVGVSKSIAAFNIVMMLY